MQQIKQGMTLWKKEGVRFFTVPLFEKAGGVICAFSTRIGGVSPAPYETLNFSRSREQSQENFEENLRRFADAAGFHAKKVVGNNYEHGPVLHHVKRGDEGRGIFTEALPHCDGLFTCEENIPLMTLHADCVPLFFYDPKIRAVAVCHAGWRGVAGHMVKNAVDALVGVGSKPSDILAAVGPCISVRNFEVGEDVCEIFAQEFGENVIQRRENRLYVDLNKACIADMLLSGLESGNITDAQLCTYEDSYLFYSHRRDRGQTGAMAAVIELKADKR